MQTVHAKEEVQAKQFKGQTMQKDTNKYSPV
jgi:hypothetical protein